MIAPSLTHCKPDSYALKLDWKVASTGVTVLHRIADSYKRRLKHRMIPGSLFDVETRSRMVRGRMPPSGFGAEEPLAYSENPPSDWKVHCFLGRPRLASQVDTFHGRILRKKFHGRDYSAVGCAVAGRQATPELLPRRGPQTLREASERLSLRTQRPLVASTPTKQRLLCLRKNAWSPGRRQGSRSALDRSLGELWENGVGRIPRDKKHPIP